MWWCRQCHGTLEIYALFLVLLCTSHKLVIFSLSLYLVHLARSIMMSDSRSKVSAQLSLNCSGWDPGMHHRLVSAVSLMGTCCTAQWEECGTFNEERLGTLEQNVAWSLSFSFFLCCFRKKLIFKTIGDSWKLDKRTIRVDGIITFYLTSALRVKRTLRFLGCWRKRLFREKWCSCNSIQKHPTVLGLCGGAW